MADLSSLQSYPSYSTYDPRYFTGGPNQNFGGQQGGGVYAPSASQYDYSGGTDKSFKPPDINAPRGIGGEAGRTNNGGANMDPSTYTPANTSNSGSTGSGTASPGAVNLLGQPNLNNRQPSLAAGWGGWDAGSSNGPAGNANFTYFSRFA